MPLAQGRRGFTLKDSETLKWWKTAPRIAAVGRQLIAHTRVYLMATGASAENLGSEIVIFFILHAREAAARVSLWRLSARPQLAFF